MTLDKARIFTSGLTGSGKRPRRPVQRTSPKTAKRPRRAAASRPPGKDWLDALDAIDERCARIETMAGLLRACDEPEEMNVKLAAQAGAFMADDLREVKALLAELGKGTR
jgi:hypothetical protein